MSNARPLALALAIVAVSTSSLLAGMPAPLLDDWTTIARFTDSAAGRLQAISFFSVTILLSTLMVRGLWNLIAADSQWLPRISFAKAAAVVLLWGVAFVVVLTMISGARELMTPGAWKKSGATYTLEDKQ